MLTRYPPVVDIRLGIEEGEEKARSDSSCPNNVIIVTPLTCVVCLQPVNLQPVRIPRSGRNRDTRRRLSSLLYEVEKSVTHLDGGERSLKKCTRANLSLSLSPGKRLPSAFSSRMANGITRCA